MSEMVRQLTTAFAQPDVTLYPGQTFFLLSPVTSEWTTLVPSLGWRTASRGRRVWKALYREKTAQHALFLPAWWTPRLTFRQWLLMLEKIAGVTRVRHSFAQNISCWMGLVAWILTCESLWPYVVVVVSCILLKLYLGTLRLMPVWVFLTLMVDRFAPITIRLFLVSGVKCSRVPTWGWGEVLYEGGRALPISWKAKGCEKITQKYIGRLGV